MMLALEQSTACDVIDLRIVPACVLLKYGGSASVEERIANPVPRYQHKASKVTHSRLSTHLLPIQRSLWLKSTWTRRSTTSCLLRHYWKYCCITHRDSDCKLSFFIGERSLKLRIFPITLVAVPPPCLVHTAFQLPTTKSKVGRYRTKRHCRYNCKTSGRPIT